MIELPEGVTAQVEGSKVTVKGPKGEMQREFSRKAVLKLDGNKLDVSAGKALRGTVESIIKNMVTGVTEGYTRKLKVLYAHFPVTIEVKGKEIIIKNFLGEKQPRKTSLIGDTKLEVKGQNVTVSGPDKEAVGQTIANLKSSMRIKDKDGRIFQDGIYMQGE